MLLILAAMLQPVYADAAGYSALSGRVIDQQGLPVQGATVALYLDGSSEADADVQSDVEGLYLLDLPGGPIQTARLLFTHPHFQTTDWQATEVDLEHLNLGAAVCVPDVVLERQLTVGFWIATLVFGAVLALVITERLHATAAALLGAAVVLAVSLIGGAVGDELFIIDLKQAIHYIDFDVIFLVLGMMITVGTIERTGVFQWTAYQAYRPARGRLWVLVLILMLLTSVASALLDNVTTMLLVAPVTLQISLTLLDHLRDNARIAEPDLFAQGRCGLWGPWCCLSSFLFLHHGSQPGPGCASVPPHRWSRNTIRDALPKGYPIPAGYASGKRPILNGTNDLAAEQSAQWWGICPRRKSILPPMRSGPEPAMMTAKMNTAGQEQSCTLGNIHLVDCVLDAT